MNTAQTTQLLRPAVTEGYARPLDDIWLLTICAALVGTALPWFLGGIAIDFAVASCGLLALGVIHLGIAAESSRRLALQPQSRRRLTLLHALGVIVLGFIWWHAGGVQNPVFLVIFALPVIGASCISRWQPLSSASLSLLLVSVIAVRQSAQLRAHLADLGHLGAWVAMWLGADGPGRTLFQGFYAPDDYINLMLQAFAVGIFGCALAADSLALLFRRSDATAALARHESTRTHELWRSLIAHLPVPAALIEADTRRLIYNSEALLPLLAQASRLRPGADVFEALRFSYPETVQELIAGPGGSAELCALHGGGTLHLVEVQVQPLMRNGQRLALMILRDRTDNVGLQSALEASEQACLIIDPYGCILGFNKLARGLFLGLRRGAQAVDVLPQSIQGAPWWQPRAAGKRRLHVQFDQRIYSVSSSAVPLPGEAAPLCVVSVAPALRDLSSDAVRHGETLVQTVAVAPTLKLSPDQLPADASAAEAP